jgi:hypothetical protein
MRIYGKTLSEIFAEMPWQFKVIVMAGTIWIPFALIHAVYIFATLGLVSNKPSIVKINSSPVNASVSDPSMTEGPDNKSVYMAYTIVAQLEDKKNPANPRWSPYIRVASTHPPCKNWSDMGEAISSTQEEIIGPDGVTPLDDAGTWWIEHPTIIHDPTDPGREYKLFFYKYLHRGAEKGSDQWSRRYWMIGYRSTSQPIAQKWDRSGSAKSGHSGRAGRRWKTRSEARLRLIRTWCNTTSTTSTRR